jgi:hypothetical protein
MKYDEADPEVPKFYLFHMGEEFTKLFYFDVNSNQSNPKHY